MWRYNLVYFGPLTKVTDRSFDPPYITIFKGPSWLWRLCYFIVLLLFFLTF